MSGSKIITSNFTVDEITLQKFFFQGFGIPIFPVSCC